MFDTENKTLVIKSNFIHLMYLPSDQRENKSRVVPHFMFYWNVSLTLIVRRIILAMHRRFIGCLFNLY
jgi:hypothetical protein